MQIITVAGRIGRDAETRNAGEGTVTSFTVAADQRNGRDKSTNWWRVSIWGKRGESLCQYIRKGDKIAVSGEFSISEYEGKTQLNVRADHVDLQGGKQDAAPSRGSAGQSTHDDDLNDIPFIAIAMREPGSRRTI